MEPWELRARESIRDLVARYNAQGDAGRLDAMLELFCEDAVLEVEGRARRGRAAIRQLFAQAAEETAAGRARYLRHFVSTHQVDLDGPLRAQGRCYFQTLTERGLDHWGRYLDAYHCDQGVWRFAERRVLLEGLVPGGWADHARTRLQRS